ncbi:MAG: ASKHA domain-containing protein [Bacillota bacterium]|nr:ASKHA domain-containing protein [Bacillota bacterium]
MRREPVRCIGVCSKCGKCKNAALMSEANDRKTRMLTYPDDFKPDPGAGYGLSFDIGTTTIVGMLWDLSSGLQMGIHAETNPQNEFGADVISRITYCGSEGENTEVLRQKTIKCLNGMIGKLCETAGIGKDDIGKATVCGNTTMSHILAGYSPRSLALAPFTPAYTGVLTFSAQEMALEIAREGQITLLPNIAGHVGGDITAGILASRFLDRKRLTILIDIGTNGEIALTDGTDRYACSTAAGPAFEGSAILHGMRASAGAIEKVLMEDGEVFFKTIEDCEPQGICGSGLIDAVAQMIDNGLINSKGRLASAEDVERLGLHERFEERLISNGKERAFVIAERDKGENILITQKDIREVQLAKGAIYAGMKLLLEEAGRDFEEIDQIIVAGAFGNYIDKQSAVTIGVLPAIDPDKIVFAGNTAGAGVSMALLSAKEMAEVAGIPARVKHIELAKKDGFQEVYMKSMAF